MKLKTTLVFLLSLFSFTFYQTQAQCDGATFVENNGIAVIETENASLPSNWKKETSVGPYTGSSYIAWRGSNYFNNPGNSIITYKVKINNPGTYRFIWRNKVGIIADHPNPSTEHNDSWLKIPDASNFFAKNGSSIVYPNGSGKTPTAAGAGSGGWFKVYSRGTTSWSFETNTNDHNGHQIYATFNSSGVYTIQVSARSNGHFIDRMVLYKEGSYSSSQAQSLSRSQTLCGGGTPPPPPPPDGNDPPTVSITNPSNGDTYNVGSDVTVNLTSNDPNGNISKHEIFVNNTKVDTDGASYSPYVMRDLAAGSYTIRAKVTDSNGATAESSVSISVGGGGTPPPPPSGDNNAPTVSITSPSNGQNFDAGSTVSVNVSSNDTDGNVTKHQVYVNNTLVDTDGGNYTPHKITNIAAGNYVIKVTVTDDDGATASTSVNISVGNVDPPSGGNDAPTVSITSPSNGQNFNVGSTVSVNVSADDSDGTVTKYQVYVNNTLVDTDGENFTPHKITNISAGSYTIKVTVTDDDGATASDTINITVGNSVPPPPDNDITLTLINSTTNSNIGPLTNGTDISSGSNVNVRANVANSNVKSVYFNLSGATSRNQTENVFPYALFGDSSGNYFVGSFNGGSHTLRVEAYSGLNKSGSLLETLEISFTVASGGKTAIAYPNPVKQGNVNVKLPESLTGEAGYTIISASGTEVERGTINTSRMGDDKLLQIDSANMKNDGVYYLIIQANYDVFTVPIIKQ